MLFSHTKSTTPSICTVDKNGNVTALKTGTGYVTVTASANGYDSVSKDVKIVVSKKSLNNGLLTLSETSYVYDGTYKKPAATVTFGGKVLQEGKDYTISYRNNLNVGVTTVIATGMGDYTGYIKELHYHKARNGRRNSFSGFKRFIHGKQYYSVSYSKGSRQDAYKRH